MAEILVVDDDRVMRDGLKASLLSEGFDVRTARDGADALAKIADRRPDLVLLDVMMPRMNGFCCCEHIRAADNILPVLFLTAMDEEVSQLRAVGIGADDYLPKTTAMPILIARMRRLLSRAADLRSAIAGSDDSTIVVRDVTVDSSTLGVYRSSRRVDVLTRTEFDILRMLDFHRGEVVSNDEIIGALRGDGFVCADDMLYVHVCHLRHKLGPAGGMISTKRRVGYCLAV